MVYESEYQMTVRNSASAHYKYSSKESYARCIFLWRFCVKKMSPPPSLMAQQPLVGQGLLIIEASWSHSGIWHSVGLLCTSDQPAQRPVPENTQCSQETYTHMTLSRTPLYEWSAHAETCTWKHTMFTRDIHPCPGCDLNPWSQQASGCRKEMWTVCGQRTQGR